MVSSEIVLPVIGIARRLSERRIAFCVHQPLQRVGGKPVFWRNIEDGGRHRRIIIGVRRRHGRAISAVFAVVADVVIVMMVVVMIIMVMIIMVVIMMMMVRGVSLGARR